MNKILSVSDAIKIGRELQEQEQSIVLTGGCFDILHIGHLHFLESAKKEGDVLFVMLEHDKTIKQNKGEHRPLNTQSDRAAILASLTMVDYVILLPGSTSDAFYDELAIQLKPAIIATTAGDPYRTHKERQARLCQAKVVDVIQPIKNKSTTKLISILNEL